MGYYVLHDPEHERAVLFDSVDEKAFGGAWIGATAKEEAESFLAFLLPRTHWPDWSADIRPPVNLFGRTIDPDATDPRCYTDAGLDRAREQWRELALDANDYLTDYGWALWDFFQSSRRDLEDFPQPDPDMRPKEDIPL